MTHSPLELHLQELRQELMVHGFALPKVEDILNEVRLDLTEKFEEAKPKSFQEETQLVRDFGSPHRLAAQLAKEHERVTDNRRFLWPALLASVYLLSFFFAFPWLYQIGAPARYSPWLFHCAFGAGFIVLGCKAGRPLIGQFAAVGAIASVVITALATLIFYPTPGSREIIREDQMDEVITRLHKDEETSRRIVEQLQIGKAYINGPAVPMKRLPLSLKYNGKILLPQGYQYVAGREMEEVTFPFTTTSWEQAVRSYNSNDATTLSQADKLILKESQRRDAAQTNLQFLQEIHYAPLPVVFWRLYTSYMPLAIIVLTGASCALTNLGWLCGVAARPLNRAVRKRRLRGPVGMFSA